MTIIKFNSLILKAKFRQRKGSVIKNIKQCCFLRNNLFTLMRVKGNCNCRQNVFIAVPHTTQIPYSKNLTNTLPDTLSDIRTDHIIVIGTIINEIIHHRKH